MDNDIKLPPMFARVFFPATALIMLIAGIDQTLRANGLLNMLVIGMFYSIFFYVCCMATLLEWQRVGVPRWIPKRFHVRILGIASMLARRRRS